MVHRIEVNIIEMLVHVLLVPYHVIPETILPHSTRAMAVSESAGVYDFEPVDDFGD